MGLAVAATVETEARIEFVSLIALGAVATVGASERGEVARGSGRESEHVRSGELGVRVPAGRDEAQAATVGTGYGGRAETALTGVIAEAKLLADNFLGITLGNPVRDTGAEVGLGHNEGADRSSNWVGNGLARPSACLAGQLVNQPSARRAVQVIGLGVGESILGERELGDLLLDFHNSLLVALLILLTKLLSRTIENKLLKSVLIHVGHLGRRRKVIVKELHGSWQCHRTYGQEGKDAHCYNSSHETLHREGKDKPETRERER